MAHAAQMNAGKAKASHPDYCSASIQFDLARQAGLVDDKGHVTCPACGSATILVPGQKIAEIHASLCTDETIHYPEMRKAGTITEDQYQAWKATLTGEELIGVYKRTPDIHVMASFTHEETALMTTDLNRFNSLMQERLRERAEAALLHQAPYRHTTTRATVTL